MSASFPVSRGALGAAAIVAVAIGAAAVATHPIQRAAAPSQSTASQARNQAVSAPSGTSSSTAPAYPPGVLPDVRLTPGKANPTLTQQVLFAPGFVTPPWRHVTQVDKDAVYRRYGLQVTAAVRQSVEVDHLIPIEVGGDNSTEDPRAPDYLSNLWAEPWRVQWNGCDLGAHTKDRVENAARKAVAENRMSLANVQQGFAHDWTALYRRLVGDFPKWKQ